MTPFDVPSLLLGTTISTYIAYSGTKRKSLSPNGAIAAWIVGFLSIATGSRGFLVLVFYKIGSFATKYKKATKEALDGDASKSAVRGPQQVLACSAVAVALSVYHAVYVGEERPVDFHRSPTASILTCSILAHYAVCLGDTLSSELGMLSPSPPVLITNPFQTVPPGTNGGITPTGTLCGGLGGVLMALASIVIDVMSGRTTRLVPMIIYGGICGLIGSLLDSLLGAALQVSYYDENKKLVYCEDEGGRGLVTDGSGGGGDGGRRTRGWNKRKHLAGRNVLTNAQVNLVSVVLVTVVGGSYIAPLVFR